MEAVMLHQAVVQEIQSRINKITEHKKELLWWQIFEKLKHSAAIKAYREHLNSYNIFFSPSLKNMNYVFDPEKDGELLDVLASPCAFDS